MAGLTQPVLKTYIYIFSQARLLKAFKTINASQSLTLSDEIFPT